MKYTPEQARQKLIAGNKAYMATGTNPGDVSPKTRRETALAGQRPYAVVLTCSDSRVPPEHIFSAGIGELFVVRTAGNIVGAFELGSIEYGVAQLHAPLLLVMGHTQCGAVAAAVEECEEGYIKCVVEEIQEGLRYPSGEMQAILDNILHSRDKIMQSETVNRLVSAGSLEIAGAVYNKPERHLFGSQQDGIGKMSRIGG